MTHDVQHGNNRSAGPGQASNTENDNDSIRRWTLINADDDNDKARAGFCATDFP